MVRVYRAARPVHRYLVQVHTQAVSLGVAIREESALEHFVGRKTYSINYVLWVEGRLLHLCKVIFRVAVQFQDSHIVEREIPVGPHFCKVKRIYAVGARLLLGHKLYLEEPAGVISPLNAFKQISLVRLPVFCYYCLGFGISKVLYPLQCPQVELHPGPLVRSIYKTVGVAPETVHMAVRVRNTSRAHGNCNLMQRLGQECPEIPVVVCAAHICTRIPLYGVVQVREFERVAEEKNRSIVPHKVPVPRICIELHCKTPDIPLRISSTPLPGHSGEADKTFCLLPDSTEY